jgi:hypothetical protein
MMLSAGVILIIIAITLGGVQHFGVYNIYGSSDNKWYFYALVAIIAVIGIILAAWAYMKKGGMPEKPAAVPAT